MKLPSAAEAIRFLSLVIFFSLPFLPGGYAVVDAETGGECLDRAEQCVFWAATVSLLFATNLFRPESVGSPFPHYRSPFLTIDFDAVFHLFISLTVPHQYVLYRENVRRTELGCMRTAKSLVTGASKDVSHLSMVDVVSSEPFFTRHV